MRCYICDTALETPNFNADHGDYEPCERCLIVIQDTIGSWTDKTTADEDDLGGSEVAWPYPPAYDLTPKNSTDVDFT